jgi:lipopolysaccharide transport system permease protein
MAQPAQLIGLLLCIGLAVAFGHSSRAWLVLPVVWLLHVAFLVGLAWILSLLNLVVRDIATVVPILLLALYVISPIGYTPEMVPDNLKFLFWINPLAYFIMAYQRIIVLEAIPPPSQLLLIAASSSLLFFGGASLFRRVKYAVIDYA